MWRTAFDRLGAVGAQDTASEVPAAPSRLTLFCRTACYYAAGRRGATANGAITRLGFNDDGKATSTLFWSVSSVFPEPRAAHHTPCAVLHLVTMRVGC